MNFSSCFYLLLCFSLFFTNICSLIYGYFYNFHHICTTIHHQLYIFTTTLKLQVQNQKKLPTGLAGGSSLRL